MTDSGGNNIEIIELDAKSMIAGIGRKATNEELIAYLNKGKDETSIPLKVAFKKYIHINDCQSGLG